MVETFWTPLLILNGLPAAEGLNCERQANHFADVSLAQWLAFTPYELVRAHLNIDRSVLAKVSAKKTPVVGL